MKLAHSLIGLAAALSLAACSAPAEAPLDGAWTVKGDESRLSFVTVKGGELAEAHSLSDVTGSVSGEGAATITIGLDSVETNIDIRNERMREFLFETAQFPKATMTAQVDPASFTALATGDSVVQSVEGTLDLHGVQAPIIADLQVTRIGADKVRVETVNPVVVDAAGFNLDGGVEKLRELAGLPAITGQVPVSVSITFTR